MFVSSEETRQLQRIERMHRIEITEVDPEGVIIPRVRETRAPRTGGGGGYRRNGGGYRGRSSGGYRGGYDGKSREG